MTEYRVDWPSLLSDIAYLLGDPHPANRDVRIPCGERSLATHIGVSRGAVQGWYTGSEPKHADGERLIARWCLLTGKARTFVPTERRTLSAHSR